jgi:hypothetical protein
MNNMNEHERARLLLEEGSLGIIGDEDGEWLAAHVADCERCSEAEAELAAAIALLRSEPVTAPAFLVSRTRTGVRIRARELQEQAERARMLFVSSVLAVVFTVATIYGGWLAYAAWGGWVTSGTGAVLSSLALIWLWVSPALLLALTMLGKREWLSSLQQAGTGRRFDHE